MGPDRLGRIGWHLARARERSGLTLAEASIATGIAVEELDALEDGWRELAAGEDELLARAYGVALDDDLIPPRTPVVVDAGARTIGIGPRMAAFGDGSNDALATYLSMIYDARGAERGQRIPLRNEDLDVLAGLVGEDADEVEARLIELMGCTPEEARSLRALLFRRRFVATAAGVVLSLGLFAALSEHAGSPEVDSFAVASPQTLDLHPTDGVAFGLGEIGPSQTIVAPPSSVDVLEAEAPHAVLPTVEVDVDVDVDAPAADVPPEDVDVPASDGPAADVVAAPPVDGSSGDDTAADDLPVGDGGSDDRARGGDSNDSSDDVVVDDAPVDEDDAPVDEDESGDDEVGGGDDVGDDEVGDGPIVDDVEDDPGDDPLDLITPPIDDDDLDDDEDDDLTDDDPIDEVFPPDEDDLDDEDEDDDPIVIDPIDEVTPPVEDGTDDTCEDESAGDDGDGKTNNGVGVGVGGSPPGLQTGAESSDADECEDDSGDGDKEKSNNGVGIGVGETPPGKDK